MSISSQRLKTQRVAAAGRLRYFCCCCCCLVGESAQFYGRFNKDRNLCSITLLLLILATSSTRALHLSSETARRVNMSASGHPIGSNPAISLRLYMISGPPELGEEETKFKEFVTETMSKAASDICNKAPATCDIGRVIAAVDAVKEATDLFCNAANLGKESASRKRPFPATRTFEDALASAPFPVDCQLVPQPGHGGAGAAVTVHTHEGVHE